MAEYKYGIVKVRIHDGIAWAHSTGRTSATP